MRYYIWNKVKTKIPEGIILPRWALAIRAILFPLDFFYWKYSQHRGYDWQTDTWNIGGEKFSTVAMQNLAKAEGKIFAVKKVNGIVTLERLDS